MRLTSSILQSLSLATGNVMPEAGDSELLIPNTMLPVLTLVDPVTYGNTNAGGNGLTKTEDTRSHIGGIRDSVAAAAALEVNRWMKLGPGLWEIAVNWTCHGASLAKVLLSLQMSTPSGSGGGVWPLAYSDSIVSGMALQGSQKFVIAVPKDHQLLGDATIDNSGAGNTFFYCVGYIANRLA